VTDTAGNTCDVPCASTGRTALAEHPAECTQISLTTPLAKSSASVRRANGQLGLYWRHAFLNDSECSPLVGKLHMHIAASTQARADVFSEVKISALFVCIHFCSGIVRFFRDGLGSIVAT
jgi:hypothetical protein